MSAETLRNLTIIGFMIVFLVVITTEKMKDETKSYSGFSNVKASFWEKR